MVDDRLTVTEIVQRTGISSSALVRYLIHDSTRNALGAAGKPPTYPAASLPMFERLCALHEQGAITPLTLAKSPTMLFVEVELGYHTRHTPESTLASHAVVANDSAEEKFSLAECADRLACTPEEVFLYIPLTGRRSDIHAHIQGLRDRAGET